MEGQFQTGICLCSQCHSAEVAGKGSDVGYQRFYSCLCCFLRTGVNLKRIIDFPNSGNLPGFYSQIMAHESVELLTVGFLPEIHLHWSPELLVEPCLQL